MIIRKNVQKVVLGEHLIRGESLDYLVKHDHPSTVCGIPRVASKQGLDVADLDCRREFVSRDDVHYRVS